ncbi:hypothetical protein [Methylocella sp.]|uniref:hypothetical protein n=1 Tax=Methylocella sp. TaxID=1978226 RepID=UPI003782D6D5
MAAIAAFLLAGAGACPGHAGARVADAHVQGAHIEGAQIDGAQVQSAAAAAIPHHGAPDGDGSKSPHSKSPHSETPDSKTPGTKTPGLQGADAHCCASFVPSRPAAGLALVAPRPAAVFRLRAILGAPDAETRGLMRPPRPLSAV